MRPEESSAELEARIAALELDVMRLKIADLEQDNAKLRAQQGEVLLE